MKNWLSLMQIKLTPEAKKMCRKTLLIKHIEQTEKACNTAIQALKVTKKTQAKKELKSEINSLKRQRDWLNQELSKLVDTQ